MKHSKSIFIFAAVIVAMFCILGFFSRPYLGDDTKFHNAVAEKGIIETVKYLYNNENGRITNHIFVAVFTLSLETIYPFLASLNSVIYILACFSLVCAVLPSLATGAKLSLSFLACALTLCFTYSLQETFYWLSGTPYFLAGTLMIFALSLAIKAFRGSRSSFILCMLVLFLNATLLEQPCVFQGIIAFIAMLFFIVRKNKRGALICCAFWLVSIAGFCVMYFAPGTRVRMSSPGMSMVNFVPQSAISMILRGLIPAFSMGVLQALQFLAKPVIYSVIFFLPAIAEKISPADEKLSRSIKAWHIVLSVFAVGVFMQFMMGVISGGGLPLRAVSVSMWCMYFVWNALWIFFYRGKLLRSDGFRNFCAKFRWLVLVLSVIVSANFRECVSDLRIAPEYAAERDARLELITQQKEKGMTVLQVPSLRTKPELIFADLSPMANNEIEAKYYGVEKLYAIHYEIYGDSEAAQKLMSGDVEPLAAVAENGNPYIARLMGYRKDPRRNSSNPSEWNLEEAEKWYTIASEAGDSLSMRAVARLLLPKDFPRAVFWLIKAHIALFRL